MAGMKSQHSLLHSSDLLFINEGAARASQLCRMGVFGLTLLLCSTALPPIAVFAKGAEASVGTLTLPTYGWAAVQHPYFRGTDKVNIYPYPMLDFLSREKTNRTYQTVILENEHLRITFLPELGGKIHEVIDKATGKPMFYVNNVVKPGLIGQCGGWTSGGVEWNTGPQGHTVSCLQPVPVQILPPARDGSRSVAIGETERIYGTRWTVVVTLRPGRSFIEERIRIYNPTTTVRPYYFWNCTAVPNTPGFRFIYPMTLGCDHNGEKFFQWPFDNGKDLTRGTNYQDASSIFAWQCDQDFFGSYDDGVRRGVVSFANHHQVPGKKAWTWGLGGFGTMHQMDLTDEDGPYNEVQTGPLLTQAQVGRLDPSEAVEWQEWWYPIHDIGGFTFANQDVAVNALQEGGELTLQMIGTGEWDPVRVRVANGSSETVCRLSPSKPTRVSLKVSDTTEPQVEVRDDFRVLASFRVPLAIPLRTPPAAKPEAEKPTEVVQAAWDDFLFAKFPEAESKFRRALEAEPSLAEAHAGLALLKIDSDPAQAQQLAKKALATVPGNGLALLTAAVTAEDEKIALDHAWMATLDPRTSVAGRALVARLLLRAGKYEEVVAALSANGPWTSDPACRARRAMAHLMLNQPRQAVRSARAALALDPIDIFSGSILWLAGDEQGKAGFEELAAGNALMMLELAAEYWELGQVEPALRLLNELYLKRVADGQREPLVECWAAALARRAPDSTAPREAITIEIPSSGTSPLFPHHPALLTALREWEKNDASSGTSSLCLGHLLFHLGRTNDAIAAWKRAAESGAQPATAYRALGMTAKTLDGDLATARSWLEKASREDPRDAIVARDLAGVLFALADQSAGNRDQLVSEARNHLSAAFDNGKGRSDFIALLARAQNRLGQYADTARMLDQVRVTIWEGAHEVHDLFEQAHLELGDRQLRAGDAEGAVREFRRALEYPANLATGKLETTREAHIYNRLGKALKAAGRSEEARQAWLKAAGEPSGSDPKIERARQEARESLDSLRQ